MRPTHGVVAALLVALTVLAPVAAAASMPAAAATASPGATATASGASTASATAGSAAVGTDPVESAATSPPTRAAADPPDPDSDVIGWENGYWYNESITVDQSDGLSDAELEKLVARTMARVEFVRQLEFTASVPVNVMTREEFRNMSSSRETDPALRRFDNVKFEALFLINESTDSIGVQDANRGSAVLGFYSSKRDEIVIVVQEGERPEISEFTLAHELVHALQDQHFNLSRYHARTRDGANAQAGLIEGDASYVEHRYSQRCGAGGAWNGTCARLSGSGGGGGGLANIGVYLVKFQPYSDGPTFIASVYRAGGWDAVNALYEDLPASTEQVIDPSRYNSDPPTEVELADRNSSAWTRVRPPDRPDYGSVGQSGIASMFVYPLYHSEGQTRIVDPRDWLNYTDGNQLSDIDPLNYGFAYAEGWDGDRMHVYVNAENETAYVWRIVWDSPEDAQEFREGYVEVLDYWGAERRGPDTFVIPEERGFADAFHVSVEGDTVTITNAPTVDQLSEVRSSVSVGTDTPSESDGSGDATDSPADDGTGDGTPAPDETTTSSPGLGIVAAVLALLGVALLSRRR